MGYLDADGYLFLTDRKAHMIISGGVNIYPQETENLLVTHPSVLDAAVIGVPNEDLGEEVKAVVQLVDGAVGRRRRWSGADRVLPGAPGALQVPAQRGLRGRAAPAPDREVVQGCVARAVLGVARHPHRVSDGAVGLPDDLVSWIEEVGGGRVVLADRMPGGARKEAWFIDLETADGTLTSLLPALRPLRPGSGPRTRGRCTARRRSTWPCRTARCRCPACSACIRCTRRCCRSGCRAGTGSPASPTRPSRRRRRGTS